MSLRTLIRRLIGPSRFGSSVEYWQRGDLAVCIGEGPWFSWPSGQQIDGPKLNDPVRVVEVTTRYGNE